MTNRGLFYAFFGAAICLGAMTSNAQAQATRTWISGTGLDSNPCSRTAPCKTLAGAYPQTASGGEIDVLDGNAVGTLTIGHALTIDGGGGQVASILASGTSGIVVNAGANERVVLRNLRLNGINQTAAAGVHGILFNTGAALAVENCVIEGFGGYGINFQPSVRANLTVVDSLLVGNGNLGAMTNAGGLIVSSAAISGGFNHASIVSTVIENGPSGITAGQNTKMELDHVTVGQTGLGGGDYAVTANGMNAEVSIDYSTISGNNFGGLHATNSGMMHVANSSITYNNTNGILADAGGSVQSYGNNRVAGNGGVFAFTGAVIPQT
jgi:hypothetical protein